MPYYAWRGVTIVGDMRKGKLFARSVGHLEQLLFDRDIALLRSKQLAVRAAHRISLNTQISFFESLKQLLFSGMRLPEALRLVSEQQHTSTAFQASLHTTTHDIELGTPIHESFEKHTRLFDGVTLAMLQIGQESGALKRALELIVTRLQRLESFNKKMRSALFAPMITFIFFLASTILIFTVIIPSFSSFLTSRGGQLPTLTRVLLAVSSVMISRQILVIGAVVVGILLTLRLLGSTARGRKVKDQFILRIPGMASHARNQCYVHFFQTMALVMQQGGHITMALSLGRASLHNSCIQGELLLLEQEVLSGTMLAKAMRSYDTFDQESCALVLLGEETGRLSSLLTHASDHYQQKIEKQFTLVAQFVQPVLLIVLGLLVGMLIFAIYIPLFQMPDSYTFL